MPKINEERTISIGDGTITVWFDGTDYDPTLETYRPRYSYSIVTSEWRYDANDLCGAINKGPNVEAAFASVLVMLHASTGNEDEISPLFPDHVTEFAKEISCELDRVCSEITGE